MTGSTLRKPSLAAGLAAGLAMTLSPLSAEALMDTSPLDGPWEGRKR